jgi:hypothetical protein
MKKNWIRFFCFWMVFFILLSPLNAVMKVPSDRWLNFYDLPKNSLDVVFLGNSHNFFTFQPELIDKIIPINSYTIGTSSANIFVAYYELKEVLRYQHPRLVVLETFAVERDDSQKQGIIFEFLDAAKWNMNRAAIANRYLSLDTMYSIIPALRTRMEWQHPYLYIGQLVNGNEFVSSLGEKSLKGANPSSIVMDDHNYNVRRQSTESEHAAPPLDNQVYLDKLYKLCKENNIQLILTSVPVVNSISNQTQYYSPVYIAQFAKENSINLLTYDLTKLNHLHFSNGAHVNIFGADYLSIEMAKYLADTLDLPLNEPALENYESLLFSDYSLSQDGNNFKIELIPQQKNLPLEYKWQVLSGDTLLYETDWQNSNQYQFNLSKDGEYDIQVSIRNPLGDYEFTAVFPFTKED